METIITSSATIEWYKLIKDYQEQTGILLADNIQHYLILTINKFIKARDLHNSVALEMLSSVSIKSSDSTHKLRRIGDRCLILSGFFPERTEKLNVNSDYFVKIGQQAYLSLAYSNKLSYDPNLFYSLGYKFEYLTNMLHSIKFS